MTVQSIDITQFEHQSQFVDEHVTELSKISEFWRIRKEAEGEKSWQNN